MKYTTVENEKLTGFTESYYKAEETFDLADWFIIDSEGGFYRLWKFLIVIMQVISSYLYAILAAYRKYSWEEVWIPLECFFGIDIIINCISDYRNKWNFKVRDIFDIGLRYIKGPFLMDFIPLIPLQSLRLKNNL